MIEKSRRDPPSPATDSAPKPGDFPIGSPKSRAAARMLAANRQDTRRRIEMMTNVCFLRDDEGRRPENWTDKKPYVEPWRDWGDALFRFVYVPDGMSFDEARKIVDRMN